MAFISLVLSKAKDAEVIEISKIEKETTHYHKLGVNDDFMAAVGYDFEHIQHLFTKKGEYLRSFAAIVRCSGEFVMGMTFLFCITFVFSLLYMDGMIFYFWR